MNGSALPSQGDPFRALLGTHEGLFGAGIPQTHSYTFSEFTPSTAPLQSKILARIKASPQNKPWSLISCQDPPREQVWSMLMRPETADVHLYSLVGININYIH